MSAPAGAAQNVAELFAGGAYDPTAAAGLIAWQRPNGQALMLRGGSYEGLPGTHPALGGGRIAWREGDAIVVADAATLARLERREAPGAGVLAVSDSLLAWRTRDTAGTDRIWVAGPGEPARVLLERAAPEELGRPALLGNRLLCHIAGPFGSSLIGVDTPTGALEILRSEPGAQLSNPSTDGNLLLYVHATGRAQDCGSARSSRSRPPTTRPCSSMPPRAAATASASPAAGATAIRGSGQNCRRAPRPGWSTRCGRAH